MVLNGTPGALPSWITFVKATRTFTFTPKAAHVGSHTLRVTGTDAGGKSAFVEFDVKVAEVNDAPVASIVPEQEVDEDVDPGATYQVLAFTDEEDDTTSADFKYEAQLVLNGTPGALPSWITFVKATRTFTFTPKAAHVGSHTLRVTGTDAGGKSAFVEFDVKVAEVNDAPVASIVPEQEVDEDVDPGATYQVLAFTDEEDDTTSADFKYEAKLVLNGTPGALPSWITFVKATRTFTFTPKAAHVGSHTLRVTGTDAGGKSAFVEFDVKVAEVNDAPVASIVPEQEVDEDVDPGATYQVLAFTDEEDDTTSADFKYEAQLVLNGTPGALPSWITFVKATRTFTFTPKAAHVGSHTLRVTGTDVGGKSAFVEFDVKVAEVNDAPVASIVPEQEVDEDVDPGATYQVLAFTDEEDDTTSADFKYEAQLVLNGTPGALPSWITFVKATRTFTFTPKAAHVGSHTLRVTGTDAGGKSAFVEFDVKVAEVNDAPVASIVPEQEVDEDVDPGATYQVLAFTDEEDDTTSADFKYEAQLVLNGTPGALPSWITFVKATRTFTFTPKAAHVGSHTLRVTGTDAGGKSAFVEFDVKVAEVNDAPVASIVPEQEVDEDVDPGATYQVLAFTDEEDDTTSADFKYEAQLVVNGTPGALPSWITFVKATRTFTFTPKAAHVGSHTLRVTGTDVGGKSAFVEFDVKVAEVNDAPVASIVPEQEVDEDVDPGATYQVLAFTDEEDDTTSADFKYEAKLVLNGTPGALPSWITFVKATRTFTFTPEAAHVGSHTLRVTGTDAGGKSAFVEFDVVVSAVNDAPKPPTVALARQEVDEDATVTYRVPAFTDEETSVLAYTFEVVRDGSATAVSASEIEQWIDFDDDPSDDDPLSPTFRTFTFTPKLSSHAGKYEVTVVATDAGIGGDVNTKESVSAMFELEVAEVNDVPEPPDAATLKNQEALEGLDLTYEVPKFTDEEDDAASKDLTYVAQLVLSGMPGDLPLWIKFDKNTRTFTFEPDESSLAGDYRLRVTATDDGIGDDSAARELSKESAYVEFMLKVIAVNDLPEGEALPNQSVTEDTPETYSFPKFTDEESSALVHTALWVRKDSDGNDIEDADGEKVFEDIPVGSWIAFGEDPDDDTKMKFTFSPDKSWHAGVYTLRVTADDGQGGKSSKTFSLQVSPENDAPVASSLVAQDDVVENTPSIYVFDAFTDEENDAAGVSLTYTFSVVRVGAEGTPVDVESWMQLGVVSDDTSKQRFSFTPSDSSHAGTYKVTVVGTDAGGKEASAEFTLTVGAFNDKPTASSLANQDDVVEDTPSIYRFDAFTDEEDDAARVPLKYSYTVVRVERVGDADIKTDVSPLWIDFDDDPSDDDPLNPTFRTFTFTPTLSSHAGKYEVTVVGADAGGKEASAVFTLTVGEFNDVPVASALQDHLLTDALVEDTPSTYKFDAFEDEETSPLTYSYTVVRVVPMVRTIFRCLFRRYNSGSSSTPRRGHLRLLRVRVGMEGRTR